MCPRGVCPGDKYKYRCCAPASSDLRTLYAGRGLVREGPRGRHSAVLRSGIIPKSHISYPRNQTSSIIHRHFFDWGVQKRNQRKKLSFKAGTSRFLRGKEKRPPSRGCLPPSFKTRKPLRPLQNYGKHAFCFSNCLVFFWNTRTRTRTP